MKSWSGRDSVERAVYKIQWFTDAPLTQMIGSATVTATQATSEVA